jgi:hypothetical protein
MTLEELDLLETLLKQSTSGPWFVRHLDDDMAMSAVAVATAPAPSAKTESMRMGNWPTEEVVAVTLLQSPQYAMCADDRWDENAAAIVALRNAAPELIRLARRALNQTT